MKFCQPESYLHPSKTFFMGEYSVLNGGPAIVYRSAPFFKTTFSACESKAGKLKGIHHESPAGKLWADNLNHFQHLNVDFHDPHEKRGGFGASTAQFAAIYQKLFPNNAPDKLRQDYQRYSKTPNGPPPSGTDLMAQIHPMDFPFFIVDPQNKKMESHPWPFPNLHFRVIHTGKKLATHQYLETLRDFDPTPFRIICRQGISAFLAKDEAGFIDAIQAFGQCLAAHHFVAHHTVKLLQQCHEHDFIITAKGCGALGADTLLLLSKKEDSALLGTFANTLTG